ncbi:P-loop containing nucleoside triphosphate hydrolase protein [Fomitiporia mediterranea MF3/22]|uniref:P-loop containing nucleoside triphosphate hydrolase protein n=1 Tax=Fomitiporia mediterranea (strain MF3/22) TaxID=694068 RepID=UPI00044090B2|nr:P-loop containing nucleoside triphosphate hydrolase protein [Fomitiporia mediterranea MF3/22]EJD03954.1 P-loop containing nucleoside triphosphate hydrolase protein [Fomitiporia mediterranea MF3/22]
MPFNSTRTNPSNYLAARITPQKRSASQAVLPRKDDSRDYKHVRTATQDLPDDMPGPSARDKAPRGPIRGGRGGRLKADTYRPASGYSRSGHPMKSVGGESRGFSSKAIFSEPFMDEAYIKQKYADVDIGNVKGSKLSADWQRNPKSALFNFMQTQLGRTAELDVEDGTMDGARMARVKVNVVDDVVGVGDAGTKRHAEKAACLSACYEIISRGMHIREKAKEKENAPPVETPTQVSLSDGSQVTYEMARQFMDYYCRKYRFKQPFIELEEMKGRKGSWEAVMTVGGRRIGMAGGKSKKDASKACYLDVVTYLEDCDPALWREFVAKAKTGKDLGFASKVYMQMSERLEDDIRDLNWLMKRSMLFRNAPEAAAAAQAAYVAKSPLSSSGYQNKTLEAKSAKLLRRRKAYLSDPSHEKIRQTRQNLPVYSKAEDALRQIEENEVIILMAATGSGKTTQIPQLILDSYIDRQEGSRCNIFCTQPRRLAAISVAQRVAKERGEQVGEGGSIGYQVRFESSLPDENGSVTYCTIGVFLRRMQTALQRGHDRVLDNVTHIVVDEVHERDIDTDLLLVVLKRLIEHRRTKGNPLKVILMSATVDATLFRNYFSDANGTPARVVEIPGRSFPVQKHFLDEFLPSMIQEYRNCRWVFTDEKVVKYIYKELPDAARLLPESPALRQVFGKEQREEELEIPYALVGLTISHVLKNSDSGHVLVFLPGWEEIQSVQKLLTTGESSRLFGLDFGDPSKFSLHVLHSSIPLAEQQVIFDPPPEGVRRIILSTNIAETSVTIPDVVYVVDTAKIKENRYDPERHISSLVSAWVGKSNLNQRAGRAGRHRPGEYYGILSQSRADALHPHQTVEMKRMDLTNVVMHVKALDFPGMEAEEVLARTIEPPSVERVTAAMESLKIVGALDEGKKLTSLGRLLLQLPIEVQLGRLVLLGSFFKCLDPALTLAAIFSSRDPFLSPPTMRKEAQAVKNSWCPEDFRSDAIASLRAFDAWYEFERRGDIRGGAQFCSDNFLSKPTLMLAVKVKDHLLSSLAQTGILDISNLSTASIGDGHSRRSARSLSVPPELNVNGDSLPLLAALIAIASQPKFAIRAGPMTYRTAREKTVVMHASSVNHRKRVMDESPVAPREKQLFAYSEKRQNLSMPGQPPGQMSLVGTTRLDPMTYVLFGAYNIEASDYGLECDEWLPVIGPFDALDDVRRLKRLMEDCMLRVFEGINNRNWRGARQSKQPLQSSGKYIPPALRQNRDNDEDESGDEEEDSVGMSHGPLSDMEMRELSRFTQVIVNILDRYAEEQRESQSRRNSRPATPTLTPSMSSRPLPGSGWRSGASTPLRYDSRPGTPSRLSAKGGW